MNDTAVVFDATAENFARDVIDTSHKVPVLVDFWAPWCGPCRSLMPLLVKLAESYGGRFRLAKVNIDEQQDLATQFGVRSVPTVKLVHQGRIVDEFMGALPEGQVRAFLDRHIPRESDTVAAQAQAVFEAGEHDPPIRMINDAWQADPDNPRLPRHLLKMLLQAGRTGDARQLLDKLPANLRQDDEIKAVANALEFAAIVQDAPPATELAQRLKQDPDDSRARFQLAAYMVMDGRHEQAMDQLLYIMQHDRGFDDDAARKTLIRIFELLGNQGPLVQKYRQKMAAALY